MEDDELVLGTDDENSVECILEKLCSKNNQVIYNTVVHVRKKEYIKEKQTFFDLITK
jgi:hypothetical protein